MLSRRKQARRIKPRTALLLGILAALIGLPMLIALLMLLSAAAEEIDPTPEGARVVPRVLMIHPSPTADLYLLT
jgi:hypothetical protein